MPIRLIGAESLERVVNLPETGMGYQLFDIGRQSYLLVISSEFAISFSTREELFSELPEVDRLIDADERRRLDGWYSDLTEKMLIDRTDQRAVRLLQTGPRYEAQPPFIELVYDVDRLAQPEMFFRFSATRKDHRILANGSFTPGTYATTFNDIRLVPSGLAAVGRYALPIRRSARYAFGIVTDSQHRMGTTIPNFGQAGGGVEVKFIKSARHISGTGHPIGIG